MAVLPTASGARHVKKIIAIFICAFIGSALRYLLSSLGAPHHLLTILAINVLGCFVMPLITGALPLLFPIEPHLVTGLSVGLVGSFTTFSTFSVDAMHLIQQHAYVATGWYVGGTLVLGWAAASLSLRLVHRLLREDRNL